MQRQFGVPLILLLVLLSKEVPGQTTTCSPENIPHVDPFLCCNLEGILDKEIVNQCRLKFDDTHHPTNTEGSVPTGFCFAECVLNTTGVVKNGNVDVPFAIQYIQTRIPDPRMTQLIANGVTTCHTEFISRKTDFDQIAELPPAPNGQRICNALSGHFLGCVHSNLFRNCPDTRWIPKPECDMLQKYFAKCPLPFPLQL